MLKKIFAGGITLLFLLIVNAHVFAQEAEPAGKKLFIDQKCNVCHSVKSQNIEKKGPPVKAGDKNAPPDLSTVGNEKSAEWITKFLNKQEMLNNKKHPKNLTLKPEEMKSLTDWLASLKK